MNIDGQARIEDSSVGDGDVPAGAVIRVAADTAPNACHSSDG